jgi:hypothetical protein
MNAYPSQPSIVPSRPLPGRVATKVSKALRAAGMLAVAATVALGARAEAADARSTTKASAETQLVGVFTGTYVNEAPVYRLPPLVVVASRKAERIKVDREEQLTRAQQPRLKAAPRRPA